MHLGVLERNPVGIRPSTFRQPTNGFVYTADITNDVIAVQAGNAKMVMIPLYQIMREAYAVYFKTDGFPEVKYSATGATAPTASVGGDWSLANAAAAHSRIAGDVDLRTTGE